MKKRVNTIYSLFLIILISGLLFLQVYIFTLSSSVLAIASICLSVLLAIALIERLLSSTHKDKINEEKKNRTSTIKLNYPSVHVIQALGGMI